VVWAWILPELHQPDDFCTDKLPRWSLTGLIYIRELIWRFIYIYVVFLVKVLSNCSI
jgi:hypothetical protein